MFLSIFAATCRPNNIVTFLDNLAKTADDVTAFEVLLKIDEGDENLAQVIETYKATSPLTIKYLATPKLSGYYSLQVGYNELLKMVNPDTYFCWLLTDEILLQTKGWDTILKKYIGFFKDDIFRIKLSVFQLKNYLDVFECMPMPDNYAVTTYQWLKVTGGWGNFWGPDSWHQCVDYFLSLNKNEFNPYGTWRSFSIFDIKVSGQEAGQGITDKQALRRRAKMIWKGWNYHTTHQAQEHFSELATRLNAHIYAIGKNIVPYLLIEDVFSKTLSLYSADQKQCYHVWCYKLPRLNVSIKIGHKKLSIIKMFPFLITLKLQIKSLDFKISQYLKKLEAMMTRKNNQHRKLPNALIYINQKILYWFDYLKTRLEFKPLKKIYFFLFYFTKRFNSIICFILKYLILNPIKFLLKILFKLTPLSAARILRKLLSNQPKIVNAYIYNGKSYKKIEVSSPVIMDVKNPNLLFDPYD